MITYIEGETSILLRSPYCGPACQWAQAYAEERGYPSRIMVHRAQGQQAEVHVPIALGDYALVQAIAELAQRHHAELSAGIAPAPDPQEPVLTEYNWDEYDRRIAEEKKTK